MNPVGPHIYRATQGSSDSIRSSEDAPSSYSFTGASPFPRCGHSFTAAEDGSGDYFLFGGKVDGRLTNDLLCVSLRNKSTTRWTTSGYSPSPRFRHASVIYKDFLIVWGGCCDGNRLDDMIYVLDLRTSAFSIVRHSSP